jgi:hypothetical protein
LPLSITLRHCLPLSLTPLSPRRFRHFAAFAIDISPPPLIIAPRFAATPFCRRHATTSHLPRCDFAAADALSLSRPPPPRRCFH